ncbi:MAG: ATP-binding protein [Candidatus Paceibacterota bacterium]|jgi:predicted kinase
MIILLDGSKGAGKTTVGKTLVERLKDAVFLSLDDERRSLADQDRPRAERNKEAFENVMEKGSKYLDKGMNLIIDCGLTNERVSRLEALAAEKDSKIYKFLLKASYETQLDRVRSRDASKGNATDEARFAEVHAIVHAKDFSDFTTIETGDLSPSEIAEKIAVLITR